MTRSIISEELCLISQVEPKSADEAIEDDTWELVPRPKDKNVIGTK